MRWSLDDWVALSDIRDRCNPGGTILCVAPDSLINYSIRDEYLLSSMYKHG